MAQGEVKKFNYKAFAADLSKQASQVVPRDIDDNGRAFIVAIIDRFCNIAGEALVNEENSKLSATEASLVVQFIGEWIFHKSVDILRAKIDPALREGILQSVAFTVYEVAKKAVEAKMPQEQLINLVEEHVKKSFTKAIEDLTKKGTLSPEASSNALAQSNIDIMAQEQVEEEIRQEQEQQKQKELVQNMSDAKVIKLASLAILIKNFPQEKIKNILQKFNKPEREVLVKYLKMPDLEDKVDKVTTMRCFEEIKNTLPEGVVVSYDKAYKKMYKIVKNSEKTKILNIIKDERPNVQDFVLSCYDKKRKHIPAHVANVISKYFEENVS